MLICRKITEIENIKSMCCYFEWYKLLLNYIHYPFRSPSMEFFSGPYFPVFSPNTGKYGPEKSPYLVTFHSVNFYSVRYSVNSVRYFGPIIRDLISHKLSIICKLIGKLKNGIHKCKPRKCPCRICKTFFSKHRFLQYIWIIYNIFWCKSHFFKDSDWMVPGNISVTPLLTAYFQLMKNSAF